MAIILVLVIFLLDKIRFAFDISHQYHIFLYPVTIRYRLYGCWEPVTEATSCTCTSCIHGFFDNATQLLWRGHNNKRQDQKESFTIIIIIIKRSL